MNSIWNKNIELFEKRFPELSASLALEEFDFNSENSMGLEIFEAKNSQLSASINGRGLHSKYNPQGEAQAILSKIDASKTEALIFNSFGLGWTAIEAAKNFREASLVLVEKDKHFLEAAFSALDFEAVLLHPKVIFLIEAELPDVQTLLRSFTSTNSFVYSVAAQTEHSKDYSEQVEAFLKENSRKEKINNATLEKFSHLWLRNSLKNLHALVDLDGAAKFFSKAQDIPFVILAAGPSLSRIAPHLEQIKKRSILVAVDTALHACLSAGVEPDFIILMDPQYYCARHMDFLSSPSSILIADNAVYPSVLDFDCKETVLCSCLVPSGKHFEKQIENKGSISAGGSVATSAWDFARKCGAREIFIAGMDLGFPQGQTHVRGSQFEEKIHRESNRFVTAEKENLASLLSGGLTKDISYDGKELLTDKKMSMFRWWFENASATALKDGQKTYSLTQESLRIQGIEAFELAAFLQKECIEDKKQKFFDSANKESSQPHKREELKKRLSVAYESFLSNLKELSELSQNGLDTLRKMQNSRLSLEEGNRILSQIDSHIMQASAKEAASLVFPTQEKLSGLFEQAGLTSTSSPLESSRIIYTELKKAVEEYRILLEKYRERNLGTK